MPSTFCEVLAPSRRLELQGWRDHLEKSSKQVRLLIRPSNTVIFCENVAKSGSRSAMLNDIRMVERSFSGRLATKKELG